MIHKAEMQPKPYIYILRRLRTADFQLQNKS